MVCSPQPSNLQPFTCNLPTFQPSNPNSMLQLSPNRPFVVARRGASDYAPENTIPAFELAIEQGADAVEMDVQYTADGELIIMHGVEVDDVSDGTGRIRGHTFEEIRALDVGSWFSAEYAGLQAPTLAEALDALAGRVAMVLELKSFTRKSEGMEEEVWEEIKRRGLVDQVTVTSFNPFLLRRLKQLAPDLRTGLMQATGMPPWYSGNLSRRWSRADDLHAEFDFIDDKLVATLRQPLWVMTITTKPLLKQALTWEPVAIITSDPQWLVRRLALRDFG